MMDEERNPYENNSIDIPDFVEDKKEESSSIDMSIFKKEDDLFADLEDDDEDLEENDIKPSKKNAVVIILAVLAALLLAVSIVSIISKANADKKVAELTTEVEALKTKVTKYETTITAINQELASKEEELKKLKESSTATDKKDDNNSSSSSSDSGSSSTAQDGDYHVTGSEGVNLRKEPNMDAEIVGSLEAGKYFEGYGEEKDSAGNLWVKTYEEYYACMKLADGTVLIESK